MSSTLLGSLPKLNVRNMFSTYYQYVRPAVYSLKLRAGVTNIIIDFKWDGGGSVRLELVSPIKTYTEDQMKITDKTSISSDGFVVCKYLRRYELTIPELLKEEIWTVKLNIENIFRYQLDIEAS
ncbi:MAG: hypothetical protein NWF08_03820 [Candidatus Bathyarchaeota archaeon]|nr:hypothetical protein [Candidatus Bathyarchaeota archaeon]